MKRFLILALLALSACATNRLPQESLKPLPVFVTVTPYPTPVPTNPNPFSQTLKPQFSDDIQRQIAQGVSQYAIQITLLPQDLTNPAGPTFSGKMRVIYTNNEAEALNEIQFRLFPNAPGYGGSMTINKAVLNQQALKPQLTADNTTLIIPLFQPLLPGQQAEIILNYTATLPLTAQFGYGLYGYEQNIISMAGFYPLIPVYDEQGWHNEVIALHGDAVYSDIALYDISITAPQDMIIVTSGDITAQSFAADGLQTIQAYGGPIRDFFVAMSPAYQSLSQTVDGLTVNSYFLPAYEQQGQETLTIAAGALQIFSRHFGSYPYRNFDVVSAPMPATLGGVEFPGVVALAQRYYDAPNEVAEFVLAHEVAHQWWYGLVGSDQVNHPWLDEALTQYSALLYFEEKYGPQQAEEIAAQMFSAPYYQLLELGADRPVAGPVSAFDETAYSAVVYGKGPLFFADVRALMGDEAFFSALRTYADSHRYGLAAPQDLLSVLVSAGGPDVLNLYTFWIGDIQQ